MPNTNPMIAQLQENLDDFYIKHANHQAWRRGEIDENINIITGKNAEMPDNSNQYYQAMDELNALARVQQKIAEALHHLFCADPEAVCQILAQSKLA